MKLVSPSEYAKMKGWSHVNVVKKIQAGIIPPEALVSEKGKRRKKINVELADKAIAERGDMQKSLSAQLVKEKKKANPTPDPKQKDLEEWETLPDDETQPEAKPEIPETPDHFLKYKSAKASREELNVRKLEMEIAEKEGRLLDADEVRKTITKLVIETKTALLNIPGKIGPELMASHDLMELEHKLTTEINAALESLQRVQIGGEP